MLNQTIQPWDARRNIVVPGDFEETIRFASDHWIHTAQRSIQQRGRFCVALSGGSTPKKIYQRISLRKELDWTKVFLFWSDERGVPPSDSSNNYQMAMDNGLGNVPIPSSQIFRMKAENHSEADIRNYNEIIERKLDKNLFDLVMLGIGEDGHTASLFPNSPLLSIEDSMVGGAFLDPQNWRMTLTFRCINTSRLSVIYAIGKGKSSICKSVLEAPIISAYPASRIGTSEHPCLWILDSDASGQ